MVDKLNTYMLSGVEEYWIVDPKQENIMLYYFKDFEIDSYKIYDKKEITRSLAFEGLSVDNSELFSRLY